MKTSRLMLTSPSTAMRLGRVTALVAFPLPAGFHALSREQKRQAVQEAMTTVVAEVESAIDEGDLVPA